MKRIMTLVLGLAFLVSSPLWAESIDWTLGTTPPANWTISPTNPTSGDVVSFAGPTPGNYNTGYSNSCVGEVALGGTPQISIDIWAKTIHIWFLGPPPALCPAIYQPVDGLAGDFGPLAPGNWTLKCTHPSIAFNKPFVVNGASSGVVYVDVDAPLTLLPPDGSSWAKAYHNLQDGLNAAQFGDEVRVADGVYKPDIGSGSTPGDREASFVIPSGVEVRGGYAGYGAFNPNVRDPENYPTVLSGDLNSDDLWGLLNTSDNSYHVVSALGLAWDATLDGFTIIAGQADGYGNQRYGGGLYMEASTPAAVGALNVKHCIIQNNKASFGGGVACLGGMINFGNTFILGNYAYAFGGAVYSDMGFIEITNGLITGNLGGVSDVFGGDAIYSLDSTLEIHSSTLADNAPGNWAPANGQAIVSVTWGPGVIHTIGVTNSILRNGGSEILATNPSIVSVRYSNIQGGHAGIGNINADPLFTNPGVFGVEGQWYNGDYTLQAFSPSINAGNKNFLPGDFLDLDEDGNTGEALPIDLAGSARVQDGQVDQGAYEGSGIPPLPPAVVMVPYVTGLPLASAQLAITSSNLVVGPVTYAYHGSLPNGYVISQNPVGGSTANVGAAVSLVVSKGPDPGPGPGPGPGWVEILTIQVTYDVPLSPPAFPITVTGSSARLVETNFVAELLLVVTASSAGGGDWSQSKFNPDPNPVPSGTSLVNISIKGTGFNPSALTPGSPNVVIATGTIYARPASP